MIREEAQQIYRQIREQHKKDLDSLIEYLERKFGFAEEHYEEF